MRMIICDDDELMVGQIKRYIQEYFKQCHIKCPEISCFYDGESLLSDLSEKDILFLDIEMPGMNGIYIGK